MTDQPQIDVRSINPEDKMQRHHTAALLAHLNQSDARVQATKANVSVWQETLLGERFGDVLDTAHGYYRNYDPKQSDKGALTIGTLGHLLREKHRVQAAKERQRIEPPRKYGGPPPHVKAKLDAFKAKHRTESKGA